MQVGHNSFVRIFRDFEADNTKRKIVKYNGVVFSVSLWQIVEILMKMFILVSVFAKLFHLI